MNSWREAGEFFFGTPLRAGISFVVLLVLIFTGVLTYFMNAIINEVLTPIIVILILVGIIVHAFRNPRGGGKH
jgi:hypothetical protein